MPDDSGPGSGAGWRRVAGSMRLRITLAAAIVTAVAVALAGWMVVRSVEDTQLGRLRDRAEEGVDAVADMLERGSDVESALAAAPNVSAEGVTTCVQGDIPGVGKRVVCTSGGVGNAAPLADGSTVQGDGPAAQLSEPIPSTGVLLPGEAGNPDIVSRDVETASGPVTVTAVAPSGEVARSIDAVGRALWVLLPGLVGLVALVAWWLAGRTLRPVEAIRLEAESIGGDSMHRRLPEPASHDEIGRLARTMNAMLGRLEDSAVRQRQFVSDASHELRSPVAAIRTDLEVALHEGDRADWPVVARAVLTEEGRLETLLADLLVLASDDESVAATRTSMVDVERLAAEEASRGRSVPVTLDSPADADPDAFVVEGVASRLDRALANLVDNAARHADSRVRVTVARQGDRVRAVVDDDGPGIPAIDRERIFERFTRLDGSRARDRGGAGLGLAVVRSIATRHGGYVWADTSPLGGARFTLELPAARP